MLVVAIAKEAQEGGTSGALWFECVKPQPCF